MVFWRRRRSTYVLIAAFIVALLYLRAAFKSHNGLVFELPDRHRPKNQANTAASSGGQRVLDVELPGDFLWKNIPVRNPISSLHPLPTGQPMRFPKVQHDFRDEEPAARKTRLQRQAAVKETFTRCWDSYRKLAWGSDELTPLSGQASNPFGGWGATLVDSLDTLWIMGMHDEFEAAAAAAANISFEHPTHEVINVFETNIRILGGLLAAYDLSGDARLLRKAREAGEMLLAAFDTHNRLPVPLFDFQAATQGVAQKRDDASAVAEIGSFTLEFVHLSTLTGDVRWFDAAQRVAEQFRDHQTKTLLPGLWPNWVNAHRDKLSRGRQFGLGALADSLYEYLLKTYAIVGGLLPMYREMYELAMDVAEKHLFFRPMVPGDADILVSGIAFVREEDGKAVLKPEGQHLVCFTGGMLALGAKLLGTKRHLDIAHKLVDGCIWAYQALPLGIMPESFSLVPCPSPDECHWDEEVWKKTVLGIEDKRRPPSDRLAEAEAVIREQNLPRGFTDISGKQYILRPEAIESVFVLYRITGREDLVEAAWEMFRAIETHTRTRLANAALLDVTVWRGNPTKSDSMESFWMGETLKYFYLMFSEPDLISLDEYVFSTEAHPFKRSLPG